MKQSKSSFKWRHFEPSITLLCVRWYCRYQLSYRDLEEMMKERGLPVDHTITIEFMLSARRDVSAAKRFFKKLMRADHRRLPFTIGTDKRASYPEAFATSVREKALPQDCKLRRVKYLNN